MLGRPISRPLVSYMRARFFLTCALLCPEKPKSPRPPATESPSEVTGAWEDKKPIPESNLAIIIFIEMCRMDPCSEWGDAAIARGIPQQVAQAQFQSIAAAYEHLQNPLAGRSKQFDQRFHEEIRRRAAYRGFNVREMEATHHYTFSNN
ncbi:17365_t:CDS:2 [Acaulospora colombiana]|uniref:17365_t:CDS:1 n=1 Tax=Acaulospora colombiana TaxID=27376 RepID=A0ACA9PQ00_9GLOM|nr:17365_t:CDS:2 [Acaulospora colombiana]